VNKDTGADTFSRSAPNRVDPAQLHFAVWDVPLSAKTDELKLD